MTRSLWILLVTSGYLVLLFVSHRVRLARARSRGIPASRFAPFDHRTLLEELSEVYEAGLPSERPAPDAPAAPPEPARKDLGRPVTFLRPDVWESDDAAGLSEVAIEARSRVRAGDEASVAEIVDVAQSPADSQALASLGIHAFLERLYAGELDAAARVLSLLPAWTNGLLSPRLVEKHLAQIAYLRGEGAGTARDRRAYRHLAEARRRIARAGAGGGFADPGTLALSAHLELRHYTHALNLEWQLVRVGRRLKRALAEHPASAILFYEMALYSAIRGKGEDAVDHLARALYYARGEAFYLSAVIDVPEVARMKPALVHQARARFGTQ